MKRCSAIVTSRNAAARNKPCGRPARYVDGEGGPRCGYHEPERLAALRARNPMIALRRGVRDVEASS